EIEYPPNGRRAIGADRLTYRLSDGYELSAPITIEIQVPNNSPIVIIPPGQESAGYWEKNVVVTPTGSLPTSGTLYCQNINVDARFAFLPISDAPDLDLVFEQDGDPLTPILVGQPAHGTVTLVPVDLPDDGCTTRYRYEYQPYPPLMKVSEILLGNVVQEMFDEVPGRVPAIREAAGRLGGFANAEFLSTDEFLQSATSALIDNVPVV